MGKSLLKGIVFLPFVLILATVFVCSNSLANGILSAKYFWFYGTMGLTSIGIIIGSWRAKKQIHFTWEDFVVLLLGILIIGQAILSGSPIHSTRLIILILLLVLYFQFRIVLSLWRKAGLFFCIWLMIIGCIEAILGLKQLYGITYSHHALYRMTGSFFNPGPFAGYLSMLFPLCLAFALSFFRKEKQMRFVLWQYLSTKNEKIFHKKIIAKISAQYLIGVVALMAIMSIALVLPAAMSRASWIALLMGSAFVLLFNVLQKQTFKNYQKKIVIAIGLTSIFLFGGMFIGMYFLKKDSADGRALIWKVSIQAAAQHPMGAGIGHFPAAYGEAQAAYFAKNINKKEEVLIADAPAYGFNEFLQLLIESGPLALLLFIGLMGIMIYQGLRQRKIQETGALIALLTFGMFSYPFSVLPFLIVFVFLLANIQTKPSPQKVYKNRKTPITYNRFVSFAGLVIVASCLINRYPTYSAYKTWGENKIYFNAEIYDDVAIDYAKIYPYLNDQVSFLFDYAQSLSKTKKYAESNRVLRQAMAFSCDPMLYNICGKNHQAMKQYQQAEFCFIHASHLVPNRLYPYYLLAKLYEEMNCHIKAREIAFLLLEKKAKVPSTAEREIKEAMSLIISQ